MAILAKVLPFYVVRFNGEETVSPEVEASAAGLNSVSITNTLEHAVSVSHGGALKADDPFTVPARARDTAPKPVKVKLTADADKSGNVVQITIEASKARTRQRRLVGDPTIILL